MKIKQIREADRGDGIAQKAYKDLGIFIAYSLDGRSTEAIQNFCEDYEIPNCLEQEDFHVTLISSEIYDEDFVPDGILNTPLTVYNFKLEEWQSEDNKKILVARFESEDLQAIHNDILREYEVESKYDEFLPHFTISYDLEGWSLKEKHQLEFNEYVPIVDLTEQYCEPLDDEWAEKHTATNQSKKQSKEKKKK